MGTPEFPDLGRHCSVADCRQIDFLPFTCDCCGQVLCLEHRSYSRHSCPKTNLQGVTVIICPLCASSIRLLPNEDPNATWQAHANTSCDPSNYQKASKKKKCPVPHCKETLVFSNTIRCRDCGREHCLKHRFGPDHKCPGPKPQDSRSSFFQRRVNAPSGGSTAGSTWSGFFSGGLARLTNATSQALQKAKDTTANRSSPIGRSGSAKQAESAPRVGSRLNQEVDICPKCGKEFADPVSLVMHVERDHGGTSRA
ncbi:zinc finger AN1 and C2H2 domain-containing stress-associated protein 13-like [Wolffia australiana]